MEKIRINNYDFTYAPLPPLSLTGYLGALAGDSDCFPLDAEAYPPSSHWPTLTSIQSLPRYVDPYHLGLVLLPLFF